MTDFTISREGSLFLLFAATEPAQAWVKEHIPRDAMYWGKSVVLEHGYALDIAKGIQADGLSIE